jgi:hypothetical protein
MNRTKLLTGLLPVVLCTSLSLAGCRSEADRARSQTAGRFQATDEVLQRAEAIVRRTVSDPRTLQAYDSLLTLEPAYLDPRFGVVANYAVWRDLRIEYEAAIDSVFELTRLTFERHASADPLHAPSILDGWARQVETAGSPTELVNRALEAADIPRPEAVSLPTTSSAADAIDAAAEVAHRILDREMLGALGPNERALLPFLVRYITVSAGAYHPVAFDAPDYYFWIGDEPGWIFEPGAARTPHGVEVPAALPSLTSIYNFFRSLAGGDYQIRGLLFPLPAETTWANRHARFTSHRVDLSAAARAFATLAPVLDPAFLRKLERELRGARPSALHQVPGAEGDVLLYRETEYGNLVIGGPGPNRYSAIQASVITDVGGNDTYETEYDLARLGCYPLRMVIDLHGDDVYSHRQPVGPGAGVFGLGILLDQEGNDVYAQGVDPARGRGRPALLSDSLGSGVPGQPALLGDSVRPGFRWVDPARVYGGDRPASLDGGFSFGASFFGIGLHLDRAGDDTYVVDKWALGAAYGPGVGVLADEAGDDWYIAAIQSVGIGFNKGVGILRDAGAGADRYQSWGVYRSSYTEGETNNGFEGFGIGVGAGWRSELYRYFRTDEHRDYPPPVDFGEHSYQYFVGGVGLVSDAGGDDAYVGGEYGHAFGFTAGIGMLVDSDGDDVHVVMRGEEDHGGLGHAAHHGTGLLLDRAGNDFYSCGGSCGYGEDVSVGYLIDIAGNDHYTDLWKHGFKPAAASVRSLGVFLDGGGLDTLSDATTDWANSSDPSWALPMDGFHQLFRGNFSFALLLGPERDRLPPALAETVRGPVTLTPVSYGEKEDGKEYVLGIGVVLIEAARRKPR